MGALAVATSEEVEELVDGELVADHSLLPVALAFANLQNSPETQRSYGSVYRTFSTYLGANATVEALSPVTIASYRGWLLERGRLPRTVAHHLSALKQLGKALGVENVDAVKGPKPPRPTPRALTDVQVKHLLNAAQAATANGEAAVSESRNVKAKRDTAMLLLMLDAGLRRSEVAKLRPKDIRDVARAASPKPRRMIKESTQFWVKVQGKGGKEREVPMTARTVAAVKAWGLVRPASDVEELFVSLKPGAPPRCLDGSAIGKMVEEYARGVNLPEDLRSPHMLRHTFCTRLVDAGENLVDVADLAGHESITTTAGYVASSRRRQLAAIKSLEPKTGFDALLAS